MLCDLKALSLSGRGSGRLCMLDRRLFPPRDWRPLMEYRPAVEGRPPVDGLPIRDFRPMLLRLARLSRFAEVEPPETAEEAMLARPPRDSRLLPTLFRPARALSSFRLSRARGCRSAILFLFSFFWLACSLCFCERMRVRVRVCVRVCSWWSFKKKLEIRERTERGVLLLSEEFVVCFWQDEKLNFWRTSSAEIS